MGIGLEGPSRLAVALDGLVTDGVVDHIRGWLSVRCGIPLKTFGNELYDVEWHCKYQGDLISGCHLGLSDFERGTRLEITLVSMPDKPETTALFVYEETLAKSSTRSVAVGFSEPSRELIRLIEGYFGAYATGESTTAINTYNADRDIPSFLEKHRDVWAPGIVLLVTDDTGAVNSAQRELAEALKGVVAVSAVSRGQAITACEWIGVSHDIRVGAVLSVVAQEDRNRHAVEFASAFTVRRQRDPVYRLVVRHQATVPRPKHAEILKSRFLRTLQTGISPEDLGAAEALLDEEGNRNLELQELVNELQFELELAWEEQQSALQELNTLQSRTRYLEARLRESGAFGNIEVAEQVWTPRNCMEAFAAAKDEFGHLVLSCVSGPIAELDMHPKSNVWAQKIWIALRGLNDYARSKIAEEFHGSLFQYRQDPPEGFFPISVEYAAKESESTANDDSARAARSFRVPHTVNSSGRCYMEAHLKIDRGGSVAPRIHFHDDLSGPTRKIYIGYIGRHLPTGG